MYTRIPYHQIASDIRSHLTSAGSLFNGSRLKMSDGYTYRVNRLKVEGFPDKIRVFMEEPQCVPENNTKNWLSFTLSWVMKILDDTEGTIEHFLNSPQFYKMQCSIEIEKEPFVCC